MAKKESLDYGKLKKNLQDEGLQRVYLLYGPEEYLREDFAALLKRTCLPNGEDDFSYKRLNQENFSQQVSGTTPVLVDFWASWCGPCRGENPNVVKVYKEFHPKGLEILSVSLDSDKEAWLKAIEDDQLTWNHVSDLKGWGSEAAQLYAVSGIPHLVVLDENNVIVAKNLRGEQLREQIASMLK